MNHSTKMRTRAARAAFVALLMSSAATTVLAAPASRDAQLQEMQRQLDGMRAQMEQMRAANAGDARLSAIQQQLDTFGAQLTELKASQETANSDIATLKKPTGATVVPKLSNGKPTFATADGAFTANFKAIVMFDGASYMQSDDLSPAVVGRDLNDGTNFRRARFGIDGKLFKDFGYSLLYEFGGSGAEEAGRIHEAFFQYTGLGPAVIKLGAMEPNIGLSAASSTSGIPLMERPSSAEIARNVAAGDARSALQIQANTVLGEGDTGLSANLFGSTAVTGAVVGAAQGFGEQQAWIGRVAIAPSTANGFQAHLGANAQYVFHPSDATGGANPRYPVQLRDRPELRVDGTRLIDTGAIDTNHIAVYGAEAAIGYNQFLIEGEYFKFDIDRRQTTTTALGDPDFDGWYVQGSWVLTGEKRAYNGKEARFDAPKQAFNFNPSAGTWGAWELAARYSTMNLNYREGVAGAATPTGGVRGGEQTIWALGVNWYLNPVMRLMLDYQNVDVDRLGATGLQIGQDYDTIAMRAQLSF
ncbi:porin [Phenylobacterium sp. LjRoot219]|uniref:OprO/OprP family phosphate-selective porin n=1 Tax=Phenylobacterium sp. LjRoot219 TaxID=3342283 RepID=UPI003ECF1943